MRVAETSMAVPLPRDAARKLLGQQYAIISGTLKHFDTEQLLLSDAKLVRLP